MTVDSTARDLLVEQASEALDEDGATFDLGDGRTLRLRVEPDDVNPFDEVDAYGKVEPVGRRLVERGFARRPDGFDGGACKLSYDRGEQVWWQPPRDVPADAMPALRRLVVDLLEHGWSVVIVELLADHVDAVGHRVVVETASLGAVDDVTQPYLAEIVRDLLSDLVDL